MQAREADTKQITEEKKAIPTFSHNTSLIKSRLAFNQQETEIKLLENEHRKTSLLQKKYKATGSQQRNQQQWLKIQKNNIIKEKSERLCGVYTAVSELNRFLVGNNQPKYRVVKDNDESYIISKMIPGFRTLADELTAERIDNLIREGLGRIIFTRFLLLDDDFHLGNIGIDENNNLIGIDFDHSFWPITAEFHNQGQVGNFNVIELLELFSHRALLNNDHEKIQKIFLFKKELEEKYADAQSLTLKDIKITTYEVDNSIPTFKVTSGEFFANNDVYLVPRKITDMGKLTAWDYTNLPVIKNYLAHNWKLNNSTGACISNRDFMKKAKHFMAFKAQICLANQSEITHAIIDSSITHTEDREKFHKILNDRIQQLEAIFPKDGSGYVFFIKRNGLRMICAAIYETYLFFEDNKNYLDKNCSIASEQWKYICEKMLERYEEHIYNLFGKCRSIDFSRYLLSEEAFNDIMKFAINLRSSPAMALEGMEVVRDFYHEIDEKSNERMIDHNIKHLMKPSALSTTATQSAFFKANPDVPKSISEKQLSDTLPTILQFMGSK